LNEQIVAALQRSGVAAPSATRLGEKIAIRVNITNHRTRRADLDVLLESVVTTGWELLRFGRASKSLHAGVRGG